MIAVSMIATMAGCGSSTDSSDTSSTSGDTSSSTSTSFEGVELVPITSSGESWGAKSGEYSISEGMYALNLISGLGEAEMLIEYGEDVLTADINGMTGKEYIVDYAHRMTGRQFVALERFNELGLELSEEDWAYINENVEYSYLNMSDLYDMMAILQDDIRDINENSLMLSSIFESLYSRGGELGYTDQDAIDYVSNSLYFGYVVAIPVVDLTTGEQLDEATVTEIKARAEGYLADVQNGANIVDFIHTEINALEIADGMEPTERVEEDYMYLQVMGLADSIYYPLELVALLSGDNYDVTLIETDEFILVAQNVAVEELDMEIIDAEYEYVLPSLKVDEFLANIDAAALEIEVEYNPAVVEAMDIEALKKLGDDYMVWMQYEIQNRLEAQMATGE